MRLMEKGYQLGVVSKERYEQYQQRMEEYKYVFSKISTFEGNQADSLFKNYQAPIRFWIENNVYNTSDTRGRTAKQV